MTTMFQNAANICTTLNRNGFKAFFVGGCVRDMLMNTEPHDIDITTNAFPTEIQRIFPDHIDTGLKHGTVSVREKKDSEFFEVTTFRIDSIYSDGRHPDTVTFTPSLAEDLARRDFTINAIAFHPDTEVFTDPFGGISDINLKVIRCVGNPLDRFIEDPLRVLRAMRFAIKLGFTIEDSTKAAMHDTTILKKLHESISKERITEELRKMLICGNPVHDIFMEFSDILSVIFPEYAICVNDPHNNPFHRHDIFEHMLFVVDFCNTNKFEIKLAALFHDIGKSYTRETDEFGIDHFHGHPTKSFEICDTMFTNCLRLSTKERELTLHLIKHHDIVLIPEDKLMRRMIVNHGEDFIRDLLILKDADIADHVCPVGKEDKWNDLVGRFILFRDKLDSILADMNAFSIKDLAINGNDIMNLFHLNPGPEIGRLLHIAFDAVMNNEIPNTREDLIEFLTHSK